MPAACWPDSNLEHWETNAVFSSSCTLQFPTGFQAGHLVLLFLEVRSDAGGSIPAVASGWTEIIPEFSLGSGAFMALWGRVLDGTEGSSLTLNNGVSRTEWMCATIWLDAKLDGDESGGWVDDSASVSGSTTVPAMTADRTDNIYLWFGAAIDNSGLGWPSGFCMLEDIEHSGSWQNAFLAVQRIEATGSTGTKGGGGTGPAGGIGVLVPMNPYAGPTTLRPVAGYVGLG